MRTGRGHALKALWSALRGQRRPGSPTMGTQLAALPRMVRATLRGRYPGLERGRLGLMLLAALYVLSPVDLVPEAALLLAGFADDALVLAWLAGAVLSETEAFLAWEAGLAPEGRRRTGPAHRHHGDRVVPGEVI